MNLNLSSSGSYSADDDENVPLTPRDSSTSTSDSSFIQTHRQQSYLAFFRSPPTIARENNKKRFGDTYGIDNRARTPLYDIQELQPSSYDGDDSLSYDSTSSYAVPDQYEITRNNNNNKNTASHRTPASTTRSSLGSARSMGSSSSSASSGRYSRASNHDDDDDDALTALSSASHLFGESILSLAEEEEDLERGTTVMSQQQQHPKRAVTTTSPPRTTSGATLLVRDLSDNVTKVCGRVRDELHYLGHGRRPPLSPRSRNLADLHYLTQQHKTKMQQLIIAKSEPYDFCLILTPQEVYSFWSQLLDFRPELLGQEVVDAMDDDDDAGNLKHSSSTQETNSSSSSKDEEAMDVLESMVATTTPTAGMHHRRRQRAESQTNTPHHFGTATKSKLSMTSPSLYSISSRTRMSMFERAIQTSSPSSRRRSSHSSVSEEGMLGPDATPSTTNTSRRRWGNHVGNSTPNMMSPPIRSLTRGSCMVRRPTVAPRNAAAEETEEQQLARNPNTLRMEDIPNQVIPRGIAARTNGMLQFLSALRRGIVVRRHRAGHEADFCKIISNNGGDTIQYVCCMEHEDAMNALKEQRVRYNHHASVALPWSYVDDGDDENNPNHDFTVPDYVAAKQYREHMVRQRGIGNKVNNLAARVVRNGSIRTSDIIAVHPARHNDPRSGNGEAGTSTLRRSKSEYSTNHTFSLVLRNGQPFRGNVTSLEENEKKWYKGEGSETQFKYLDLEAATEGEYWLIFRGFLLLQRDAAVGRFAEQRAAGIGSHYNRLELEQREQADLDAHNRLHQDEFHEPVTVGCLEKMIVKYRDLDTTYMEGFTLPGAVPPPSDFFLGFKSPGTSIWSRLRQAGLETERAYSLDPRRVMIKIRCPSDRLMEVAEVLRLKLKTKQGDFAPFREDMIDDFKSEPLDVLPNHNTCHIQFRSSIRQNIIDFIIGSRIRDSGAELGQTTDLGKMIQARVPLHMNEKLDAIYASWFYFWRVENWMGRDGRSLTHKQALPLSDFSSDNSGKLSFTKTESTRSSMDDTSENDEVPGRSKRFFVGCFYQPLDSIEQYFGEKVAFYFSWLQHTAAHLLVLTVAGLIVFICQLGSHNWDHPLRPFYAMFVMLWTFIVLINWKKRANFLAYRWGTMDYKEQETTRPQFRGDYTRDAITGEWVVTYPKWKRWLKYLVSFPLTLLFTSGALILILAVHANRDLQLANYIEQKTNPGSEEFQFDFAISAIGKKAPITDVELTREHLRDMNFWMIIVGMPAMLGLCLPLLNLILMRISIMLNDFENYRTESEYRSYLIVKVFSFRFVCYFATLYYYAFVSTGTQQAIENGILRVGTGVLVYTTVAHWWQIFLQVYFPILIRKLRLRHRRKRLIDELREIELEEEEIARLIGFGEMEEDLKKRQIQLINKRLLLEQAQDDIWLEVMRPQHDSFPEYIQAVVQFTFVSCFSVVLPITPLICLFNYLVAMRLDAYKLCKGRRRPLAEKTGGIGVWEHLLHIVAVISVLTNCWLMGFTTSTFIKLADKIGEVGVFALVVGWEHVMLLIKYIMQKSISTLPKSVRDDIKRKQYELNKQRNSNMRVRQGRRTQFHREEEIEGNETTDDEQGAPKEIFRQRTTMNSTVSALPTIPSEDHDDGRENQHEQDVFRPPSRMEAKSTPLQDNANDVEMGVSVDLPPVSTTTGEQPCEVSEFTLTPDNSNTADRPDGLFSA